MKKQHSAVRASRRLFSSVKGGAAVELAVILPVLLLIAIGVSDLGRLFFTGITVANAARAGASWGAQSTAMSGMTAQINQVATEDAANAGAVTVSSRRFCQCDNNTGEVADCTVGDCGTYGEYRFYVEVTVSKAIDLIFSYPGIASPVALSRKATFRVQ